jgi:hypothetical protein
MRHSSGPLPGGHAITFASKMPAQKRTYSNSCVSLIPSSIASRRRRICTQIWPRRGEADYSNDDNAKVRCTWRTNRVRRAREDRHDDNDAKSAP